MSRARAATTAKAISVEQAMLDPRLLGAGFGDQKSWQLWRTTLKAAFGIKLNRDEAKAAA